MQTLVCCIRGPLIKNLKTRRVFKSIFSEKLLSPPNGSRTHDLPGAGWTLQPLNYGGPNLRTLHLLSQSSLHLSCLNQELIFIYFSGQVHWTISYVERYLGTDELPKSEVISFLQRHADAAFLREWKLTGVPKSIRKNRNCSQLIAAYKVHPPPRGPTLFRTGSLPSKSGKKTLNFTSLKLVFVSVILCNLRQ